MFSFADLHFIYPFQAWCCIYLQSLLVCTSTKKMRGKGVNVISCPASLVLLSSITSTEFASKARFHFDMSRPHTDFHRILIQASEDLGISGITSTACNLQRPSIVCARSNCGYYPGRHSPKTQFRVQQLLIRSPSHCQLHTRHIRV